MVAGGRRTWRRWQGTRAGADRRGGDELSRREPQEGRAGRRRADGDPPPLCASGGGPLAAATRAPRGGVTVAGRGEENGMNHNFL